jgi:flagellum-specific ATP synthase
MFSPNALRKLREERARAIHSPLQVEKFGKVVEVVGTVIEAQLQGVPLGALVKIHNDNTGTDIEGEVVGFRKDRCLIVPFSEPIGVYASALVQCIEREPKIWVGPHLLGRVVDGYGRPIDGKGGFEQGTGVAWNISREPLNPLTRRRIRKPLDLGVRVLNSVLSCGEGQRIGIMAGSGVGKSVLLGMIARYTEADINVIALVGERGREVREFLEENLGDDGLARSIVVVSTGDQSAMSRVRAANVATAIGEYFRDEGLKVLLMMDSLTRVAMAQREIGLAVGEPPTAKGYTPSVFSMLPRLLERAGNSQSEGSLTGIYTVLVDGDDFNDPICDAARSILDGHINLSRQLASRNHFPAVEVLTSASRVMVDIVDKNHQEASYRLRELMAIYEKNEDLIAIGAYIPGSNPKIDLAIQMHARIEKYLRQGRDDRSSFDESKRELLELVGLSAAN